MIWLREISPFVAFLTFEWLLAGMRAFVILEHMFITEWSRTHSTCENLILAVLPRLRTNCRNWTGRSRSLQRGWWRDFCFCFGGSPLGSLILFANSVILIHHVVVVVGTFVVVIAAGDGAWWSVLSGSRTYTWWMRSRWVLKGRRWRGWWLHPISEIVMWMIELRAGS